MSTEKNEPAQDVGTGALLGVSENCPECRYRPKWNGVLSHSPTCSRIDLETARWYAAKAEERIDKARKYADVFVQSAQRWEGKFRVVCHENNKLRQKLYSPNG